MASQMRLEPNVQSQVCFNDRELIRAIKNIQVQIKMHHEVLELENTNVGGKMNAKHKNKGCSVAIGQIGVELKSLSWIGKRFVQSR